MYKYYIDVLRVVDGDTIDAMVDLGFDIRIKKRIRFLEIDAPETRTLDLEEKARGIICKERVIELLNANDNKAELISHGVGKYGRVLGVIRIRSHRETINDILISEGLASKYLA
jgi:micrococcal nuclease